MSLTSPANGATSRIRSRSQASRARDPLAIYLDQIGHIPLLTQTEAEAVGEHLTENRRNLRRWMLSNEFLLRGAIEQLHLVATGQLRVDRAVDTAARERDKNQRLRTEITAAVPRLRRLLRLNCRDFRLALSMRRPKSHRHRARRRLIRRRMAMIRTVEQFHLRAELLQQRFNRLVIRQKKIARLKQALNANLTSPPAEVRSRRNRLRRLILRTGDTSHTLRRRIEQTRRCRKRYDAVKQELVEHNLRLVVSVAKHHRNRGVSFCDLIQEGNAGLLRAADKFDHRRGCTFATYAVWWVRESINSAIAIQSSTIRLPRTQRDALRRLESAREDFVHRNEREPNVEELVESSGVSLGTATGLTGVSRPPASLDAPAGAHDEDLHTRLVEPDKDNLSEKGWRTLRRQLNEALRILSQREKEVLSLRFGLADGQQRTLEEVGKVLSLSRETIRKIEKGAVRRLQQPGCLHPLLRSLDGECHDNIVHVQSA